MRADIRPATRCSARPEKAAATFLDDRHIGWQFACRFALYQVRQSEDEGEPLPVGSIAGVAGKAQSRTFTVRSRHAFALQIGRCPGECRAHTAVYFGGETTVRATGLRSFLGDRGRLTTAEQAADEAGPQQEGGFFSGDLQCFRRLGVVRGALSLKHEIWPARLPYCPQ